MGTLPPNLVKEELSIAFLHTIVSRAGFIQEMLRRDADSVDTTIRSVDSEEQASVRIDLQLKATATLRMNSDFCMFTLKKKNYDNLRKHHTMSPRYLVVLRLPNDENQWLHQTEQEMTTRHAAYWCCLQGAPEIDGQSTVVRIPRENTLTVESLTSLIDQASERIFA